MLDIEILNKIKEEGYAVKVSSNRDGWCVGVFKGGKCYAFTQAHTIVEAADQMYRRICDTASEPETK